MAACKVFAKQIFVAAQKGFRDAERAESENA
jgi:hypothetical protein